MKTLNQVLETSRYPLRGLPYRIADDFDDPMPELTSMVAESGPDVNEILAYPYVEAIWK